MSVVEGVGFVTGALCVWLVLRQNVWNFPVGLANNAVFVVLFLGSGLYADAALQLFFAAIALHGWWSWLRGGPRHSPLRVQRQPAWGWPAVLIGIAAGTALCWALLSRHTDSTVPGWDALTTSLSVVAQLMTNRKWVGSWLVWIAADVLYVGLYVGKGLLLTALLYAGFVALCLAGLRAWRRALQPAEPVPA